MTDSSDLPPQMRQGVPHSRADDERTWQEIYELILEIRADLAVMRQDIVTGRDLSERLQRSIDQAVRGERAPGTGEEAVRSAFRKARQMHQEMTRGRSLANVLQCDDDRQFDAIIENLRADAFGRAFDEARGTVDPDLDLEIDRDEIHFVITHEPDNDPMQALIEAKENPDVRRLVMIDPIHRVKISYDKDTDVGDFQTTFREISEREALVYAARAGIETEPGELERYRGRLPGENSFDRHEASERKNDD